MKNNIEQLRKTKKLTIRQLAEKAGIGYGGLCDIQNGNTTPSIDIAYRISKALGKRVYSVFPEP